MDDQKIAGGTLTGSDSDSKHGQPKAHHPTASTMSTATDGNWLCCVPCYWLKTNNSVHKASLTMATLIVTSLLVASPVLFLISAVPTGDTPPRDCRLPEAEVGCLYAAPEMSGSGTTLGSVCDEPQCLSSAERILSSMDQRVDPCRDMFRFSCGRWRSDTSGASLTLRAMQENVDNYIQQLLTNASLLQPVVNNQVGQFYKSCTDIVKKPVITAPMYALLDRLGGYLPPGAIGPTDLANIVTRMLQLGGTPLVKVRLCRDPIDSNEVALFVDVPKTEYNSNKTPESEIEQLLTGGFIPQNMTASLREKEMQEIVLFIKSVLKIRERSLTNNLNVPQPPPVMLNLTRLQIVYPLLNWNVMFDQLGITDWDASQLIYVTSPTRLTMVTNMAARYPRRIVHNALLVMYAWERLQRLVQPAKTLKEQRAFCTQLTKSTLSNEIGSLYTRQFPEKYVTQLEQRMLYLLDQLKETFASKMQSTPWLNNDNRNIALHKLRSLKGQFIRNSWIPPTSSPNDTNMIDIKKVLIDPDDFFGSVIRQWSSVASECDRSVFSFTTTARYEPKKNAILIPLALVVQSYRAGLTTTGDSVLWFLTYATLGSELAREMLHGFDLVGGQFDESGRQHEWLGPAGRLGFEARIECITKQFPNSDPNTNVADWNVTRNERMVAIGALQTAHQAWRRIRLRATTDRLAGIGLSIDQLFHVAAAQMHCSVPAYPQRVNVVMMYCPSFSEAFNCPVGSPMNPIKKCSTW